MREHTVHPPSVNETAPAFPALAENLYLQLGRQAQRGGLTHLEDRPRRADEVPDQERLGIADIRERLGERSPQLSGTEECLVRQHFDRLYDTLPTTLPRYNGHHEHDHGDGSGHQDAPGCGSFHGPVQRFLERVEDRVGDRLGGRKTKAAVLIGMRSLMFCICPGDDLVALAAQTLGGAGHSIERTTGEEYAVLPGRVRIVRSGDGQTAFEL